MTRIEIEGFWVSFDFDMFCIINPKIGKGRYGREVKRIRSEVTEKRTMM